MPENMLVSSLNQEMTRRMMNTSELLDIDRRVRVVNDYAQKLINSGFGIDQSRKIIVGGLVSYERRVKLSKDEKLPGWRPLHEGAGFRKAQRMKKKILLKSTWFKTGKRKETERVEDHDVEKNLSPKKKLKMGVVDARTGYSQERVRKKHPEKKKELSANEIETITVMFVEQTVGGVLAKRLQEAEDRISKFCKYRIRMVETSGTQLCRLLPNTNPWSGMDCGRSSRFTCQQGDENLLDCKRRNLVYESTCTVCEEREEALEKESVDAKKNGRGKSDHGGVYVGETARSLFERAAEHRDDAEKQHDDSHMMKHWILDQQEEKEMPRFEFRMVASFQDSLTRQDAESVRID